MNSVKNSLHPSGQWHEFVGLFVYSFGENVQLLHPFHQQFNDQSGARILRLCQFQQKKTRIAQVGIFYSFCTKFMPFL